MLEKVIKRVVVDDHIIDTGYAFAVIDPVWSTINIYEGPDIYEQTQKAFSSGQIQLTAIHWHISEVCNGGHYQFYSNSTGIVWPEALDGYRTIGLPEVADILQEAADRYGGNLSRDRDTREAQIDAQDYDLEDLDKRFYAVYENDQIEQAMMKYIRSHRSEFYFDGEVERFE